MLCSHGMIKFRFEAILLNRSVYICRPMKEKNGITPHLCDDKVRMSKLQKEHQ